MKVVLIRPSTLLRMVSLTVKPSPPLGMAFIASALRNAGHQVIVIDAIADNTDQYYTFKGDIACNGLTPMEIASRIPSDTEVIGLSIMFTNNWLGDRELIDFLGESFPRAKIIAGGEHITGLPEECIKQTRHLLVCILGEGEETVVDLLKAFETSSPLTNIDGIVYRNNENKVITNSRRNRVRDIGSIPWPAWDLFPLKEYKEKGISYGVTQKNLSLPILATRGCPYECTFCSSPNMWGTRYYMRTADDVLSEIKYMKETFGADNFDFYDLTAIINKRWILELAQKIVTEDIKITWQIPAGTRSEAIDDEVAFWLYKSGCRNITYAPESGSNRILQAIHKRVHMPNMKKSFLSSKRNRLSVKLNIIIGFPEETHLDIWKTIAFLIKASWIGVNDTFAAVFIPYTGCEQFNRLVSQGKIDPTDDQYYYDIIDADSIASNHFYNEQISAPVLKFYRFLYFATFYGTNWFRYPNRLVRMMRNIFTRRFETRGEMSLHTLLTRPFKGANKPQQKLTKATGFK